MTWGPPVAVAVADQAISAGPSQPLEETRPAAGLPNQKSVYKRNIGPLWKQERAMVLEETEWTRTLKTQRQEQDDALARTVTVIICFEVCL